MTSAAQSRLIALRRNFDRSMAYFNVRAPSAHAAWLSALNDIDKAERCYAAIARSLVNGKDGATAQTPPSTETAPQADDTQPSLPDGCVSRR